MNIFHILIYKKNYFTDIKKMSLYIERTKLSDLREKAETSFHKGIQTGKRDTPK